ncbi:hypothetical protein IW261DRAFT_1478712 [Armillaria novae-zelandiae]|uniref:Uncharacterized protein n=1 Tax=Armillaria novae-zelandiae TaxID=153914 RepID=A0AA39P8T5_9AGAR|nr:hypothetical protein IW261DRAFT_1478712 [Armillaria novae-zelandiae]
MKNTSVWLLTAPGAVTLQVSSARIFESSTTMSHLPLVPLCSPSHKTAPTKGKLPSILQFLLGPTISRLQLTMIQILAKP